MMLGMDSHFIFFFVDAPLRCAPACGNKEKMFNSVSFNAVPLSGTVWHE